MAELATVEAHQVDAAESVIELNGVGLQQQQTEQQQRTLTELGRKKGLEQQQAVSVTEVSCIGLKQQEAKQHTEAELTTVRIVDLIA